MVRAKTSRVRSEPKQERSRRTEERLLDAMEYLLTQQPVEQITVETIVERAHTSVGAFYKRFASREELLPRLLTRLQSSLQEELERALQSGQWARLSLAQRIDAVIDAVAAGHLRSRELIRACVSSRFYSGAALSEENLAAAQALMNHMRGYLLERASEIQHPDPPLAVRLGLYMTLQSLQTALLFEQLPREIDQQLVVTEAKRMLRRYLGLA